ncbi:C2HC5 finger protein [Xylariomycetidae sp. FL2044]|nr:C2HC5 finger protein [Xylariomycetidae sp. FL2044]
MSVSQLSRLLPLPEEELKQILDYAATLSKPEAAEHFRNLLGDAADAVDFIASFNSRRGDPTKKKEAEVEPVPRTSRAPKKKKPNLHALPPRQLTNQAPAPGTAYNKKDNDFDYISRRPSPAAAASGSGNASPARLPTPPQRTAARGANPPAPKPPPSAAGHLISDVKPKKSKSTPASRSSTPGPKTTTKVNISGGTAMHGSSTIHSDLDDAIRALEMTTNPSLVVDDAERRCNCVGARHPVQTAAPNCLSCGKVICLREGLGPCTFCGSRLLSSAEVSSIIKELRAEQGREKQAAYRDTHRRAEVSKTPAPFTKPREEAATSDAEAMKALEHRDRLLGFQAQNARRTTVRDEASDFDVGNGRGNMWASPEERARELKRQQKLLREMEWNARPDYEKRRQVVSIDLVGGKVVRKMAAVERPESPTEEEDDRVPRGTSRGETALGKMSGGGGGGDNRRDGTAGTGAFSRNPLLGGLIKPVFDAGAGGDGAELEGRKTGKNKWRRRVQDDLNDNEAVILDGGAYGGGGDGDGDGAASAVAGKAP